jgi:hypothetical protein
MAKFKPCNYDQMVMLPISLENQLVPGSLEHTINELVEKHIDLSVFDGRYNNDDIGASAIACTTSTLPDRKIAPSALSGPGA